MVKGTISSLASRIQLVRPAKTESQIKDFDWRSTTEKLSQENGDIMGPYDFNPAGRVEASSPTNILDTLAGSIRLRQSEIVNKLMDLQTIVKELNECQIKFQEEISSATGGICQANMPEVTVETVFKQWQEVNRITSKKSILEDSEG